MSAQFVISIPEREWKPFSDAPKNGTLLIVRDDTTVDLYVWDRGEWAAELGICEKPTHYAVVSITEWMHHK